MISDDLPPDLEDLSHIFKSKTAKPVVVAKNESGLKNGFLLTDEKPKKAVNTLPMTQIKKKDPLILDEVQEKMKSISPHNTG